MWYPVVPFALSRHLWLPLWPRCGEDAAELQVMLVFHVVHLPLLVPDRSSLQDSQAGLTRPTMASSPVEFGSLDAGRR
jgi:hypothetical protein